MKNRFLCMRKYFDHFCFFLRNLYVFECLSHPSLLAALVSSGWHLFLTMITIVCLAVVYDIWIDHGEVITYTLLCYVALSPVNGYIGGAIFSRMSHRSMQMSDSGTEILKTYVTLPKFALLQFQLLQFFTSSIFRTSFLSRKN